VVADKRCYPTTRLFRILEGPENATLGGGDGKSGRRRTVRLGNLTPVRRAQWLVWPKQPMGDKRE
jgi:hypothetical protein